MIVSAIILYLFVFTYRTLLYNISPQMMLIYYTMPLIQTMPNISQICCDKSCKYKTNVSQNILKYVTIHEIFFLQLNLGVREYNNSIEMQLDMEEHCKGNCFAINYEELPDPRAGGRFRYSLSSNQMRISPKKRFVNDEDINHQKGIYIMITMGLLRVIYIFLYSFR